MKRETLIWSLEKMSEKQKYWRTYREKRDTLDLDVEENLDMIAKRMEKIPVRQPRLGLGEHAKNRYFP